MSNADYFTDGNIAGVLIVPHAVFSFIATILAGLRWYTARHITKIPWQFEESVCIAALIANHIMLITEGIASHYGLGQDMVHVLTLPHGVSGLLKNILVVEIAYGIACPLSKLAVLAMYYRIFKTSTVLRYCLWAIASMLIGWGIAVVVVSIFSCTPVHGFWDLSVESECIDSSKFYIGITVPNIVFDVLTVALPVNEIWKLQMGRKKKMAITSIFMLGGSVVFASIARLVLFVIYQPGGGPDGNNLSRTVVIPHTASAVETCLAIIGACLPPCASLFLRAKSAVRSKLGSNKTPDDSQSQSQFQSSRLTFGKLSNRNGAGPGRSKNHNILNSKNVEGDFERLDEESSLQGSTDGLYPDDPSKSAQEHDYKRGIMRMREVRIFAEDAPAESQQRSNNDIPLSNMSPTAGGYSRRKEGTEF